MDNTFYKGLRWFRGKARDNARHALDMLTEAIELGYWPKNYSRKVRAALDKVPRGKVASEPERDASAFGYNKVGHAAIDARYGSFGNAPRYLAAVEGKTDAFAEWVRDVAPWGTAIATLDATRPKPTYVFKTLSKEVVENLAKHVGIDLTTIEAPKITWDKVEYKNEKGETRFEFVPTIHWPEGTVHNASKFFHSGNNLQCQACGHAIRNAYNWVPLFGTTPAGPRSLWVGRDCAEKLFGCEVTGEAKFERG